MVEGRKDDAGKLRLDLIPIDPWLEVARVYTIGAEKYGENNWRLGMKWSRLYGAALRHLLAYWNGERLDPENGQHHLAAVVFCCLALMEYEKTHKELDDRLGGIQDAGMEKS